MHSRLNYRRSFENVHAVSNTLLANTLLFCFCFLNAFPLPFWGNIPLTVPFLLINVYYWSIHGPDYLYTWTICLAGLVFDSFTGTLIGMTPLVLLVIQNLLKHQQKFLSSQIFIIIWTGFVFVSVGYLGFQALLFLIFTQTMPSISSLLSQFTIAITFFPLVYTMIFYTHKLLLYLIEKHNTSIQ